MQNLPFRTRSTSICDDDLILLDVLFDGAASTRLLRRDVFHWQWNLGYSHNLTDNELRSHLLKLCELGVIKTTVSGTRICFQLTALGRDLWSQERCPDWSRFCRERYREISQGRTLMSVVAVSTEIRDDFLRVRLMNPARRRTARISDFGLVPWKPFGQLQVGMATYVEQHQWTLEELSVQEALLREYRTRLERERTWWRTVPELQRFVPNVVPLQTTDDSKV